jgi:integrase/recombinase XerC
MRLSEAVTELCAATRANGRSPRTVEAYREKLGHLVRFLDDPPIEAVTVADLRRFIAAQMDAGLSPFTVASRTRSIKRLFNFAVAEGIIDSNPAQGVKVPKPKRKTPKGIDPRDMVALLKTTEGGTLADLRDRALIFFLADTGARVGGLCGLRLQDLDLDAMLATVTGKRGKTRLVPFTDPTAEALRDWLAVRPQDKGDWVFIGLGKRSRGALSPSGILQMLQRRARAAGIEGPVNPHSFRHAFARHYLLDGGDLGTLSQLMGHESVSITKEYYAIFTVKELQAKHRAHSAIMQLFGGQDHDR